VVLPEAAEIKIEVVAVFVPTGQQVLSLSLTGPRRLGVQRKAETIAGELELSLETQIASVGGEAAILTLLAEQAASREEPETSTETAEVAATGDQQTTEEQEETGQEGTPDPAEETGRPEETEATPETETKATPTEEELALARRRKELEAQIRELEGELAVLNRKRAVIRRRARIAWIAGGALLGGAGGAWAVAENNYGKYEGATLTQDAVDYREKTMLFRNLAIGAGVTGGTVLAGSFGYRFLAMRNSGLADQIRETQIELQELRTSLAALD
jgi:hypothetical protein